SGRDGGRRRARLLAAVRARPPAQRHRRLRRARVGVSFARRRSTGMITTGPRWGDTRMNGASRPRTICLGLALALAVTLQPAAAEEADDAWADIRAALFADRPIHDGAGVIHLAAPQRAHDAAIVPIEIEAEIPQT